MIFQEIFPGITTEMQIVVFIAVIVLVLTIQWILLLIIMVVNQKIEKIPLEIVNAVKFLTRLGTAIFILYIALVLFEVPLNSIFGISAILGAIITFGSLQWITNFIAGLYIIITRPFGVGDFIEIREDTKGEIIEITLNYTKIKTIYGIFHLIPNRVFLKANITNFTQKVQRRVGVTNTEGVGILDLARMLIEEKVVRYTFNWGAPLGDVTTTKYKIQEVCDIFTGVFGYKPEFFLYNIGYRMQFKFIVVTHNAEALIENINDFRNEIVA
ncbi:MAG: mechanosensitive ion channel family protein, partial [Candidatus Hodarchaeota archaeon]